MQNATILPETDGTTEPLQLALFDVHDQPTSVETESESVPLTSRTSGLLSDLIEQVLTPTPDPAGDLPCGLPSPLPPSPGVKLPQKSDPRGRKSDRECPFPAIDLDESIWALPTAQFLDAFAAEIWHDTGGTAITLRIALNSALGRWAALHGGEAPRPIDLFTDVGLLGAFMASDWSPFRGRQLGAGTMKQLRTAVHTLIVSVPPPPGRTRDDMRRIYVEARSASEEIVGLKRRSRAGHRRTPEEYIPTPDEIDQVINCLRKDGSRGLVIGEFVGFLFITGVRNGAALDLTAGDLRRAPDGTSWVFVHEKSRRDRRALLVRPDHSHLTLAWQQLDPDTPLWTIDGRPLTGQTARRRVTAACEALGIPRFRLHALRKAFARYLEQQIGIHEVMLAGGWRSTVVLEQHYLRNRRS